MKRPIICVPDPNNPQGLEYQLRQLRDMVPYCDSQATFTLKATFSVSDSPELQAALDYLSNGGVDVLLIDHFDRLTLNTPELAKIVSYLENLGMSVQIVAMRKDSEVSSDG